MVKSIPKVLHFIFFFGGCFFAGVQAQSTENLKNNPKKLENDTPEIDRIQEVNIKQNRQALTINR